MPGEQLTPSGQRGRIQANLAAIRLSRELGETGRAAGVDEQHVLAGWSSWGAVPAIFDEAHPELAVERVELRGLLSDKEWDAARRTTINAHYTDPAIVAAMWRSLEQLGFDGGQVLEPGCGSGTFLGLAPESATMTGVELDPVTAGIAGRLYPQATVRAESFADTSYPRGHFDAAVGNVPFGNVTLYDKLGNPHGHSLHNHFIVKSLGMVREGGLAAFVTSSYTMDQTNPSARRDMHALADLVGAVRLPTGSHRRTAGTEVVTDVLLFRRREAGQEPGDDAWTRTEPRRIDGEIIRLGGYFAEHPEQILGELTVGHGMYGAQTVLVITDDLPGASARMATALAHLAEQAAAAGMSGTPRPAGQTERVERYGALQADPGHWLGHIEAHSEGFRVLTALGMEDLPVPRTQHGELRSLLQLRDQARTLLASEAADVENTPELAGMRTTLAGAWEQHVGTYGPINRSNLQVTSRLNPNTGEPVVIRRQPPVMRFLRRDPFGALVTALELYDDTEQRATAATLLRERVVAPRPPILGADTADDALSICLNDLGRADLPHIAQLLGMDEAAARDQLGELVFDDPAVGAIVTRPEYLSGNVRIKLSEARAAAADDPVLASNVAALEAVQPQDLTAEDIRARLGAVWIPDTDHEKFLRELTQDPRARVQAGGGGIWEVEGSRFTVEATSEWGTSRYSAGKLMEALLENRPITVYDKELDGTRTLNATETEAAREKANALQERFGEWVWEDPERATRLAGEYNQRFNCLVLRNYDAEGERLVMPGLARGFVPLPHQRSAVARMLSEPAVGLFHQVGAGKTAEMVIGAMEMRRLGMARKPCVVVPNHMLEQFSREWLQLYPQARVLAANSEDLQGDRRREFVARAATNDWDAVILTQTAFERIPVSRESMGRYRDTEVAMQRERLEQAKGNGNDMTIKRLEKALIRVEEDLQARMDAPRDPGISFEETGIDYLIVDEAHMFKNLATQTNITDANITGSKRAQDLHMKVEVLRERHGERVATFATATPIANSITEAHVMQRYLRPDLLRAAGVENFDAWAATFGETVTDMEMRPGGGWKEKTRLARYANVPELLKMWQMFADVKTAEDLNLPSPPLRERPDGRRWPENVVIDRSPELAELMDYINRESEIPGGREDPAKMLRLYTMGRAASLDLRVVNSAATTSGPSKLTVAADRIADIYRRNADNVYLDAAGEPSAVRGAMQIVFCDLSTPKNDGSWNAYDQLKANLIERGVPAEGIRFVHEARNDVEKARLFAAARGGHVSVLMGSTSKMGVGTNVQDRTVALHDLDCPWRPADMEQRSGRMLRRGNQNPEVELMRYVVEQSFDTISYQIIERKSRSITQVMRGRLDVREIDDIGDSTLAAGETKAVLSGDPLLLERTQAEKEVNRLERLARAHQSGQSSLGWRLASSETGAARAGADLPLLTTGVERSRPTRGEAFTMTIGHVPTDKRAAAGTALAELLRAKDYNTGIRGVPDDLGVIAACGGHSISLTHDARLGREKRFALQLTGVPRTSITINPNALGDGQGLIRQLENRIASLPELVKTVHAEHLAMTADVSAARAQLGQPFKHTSALTEARHVVADVHRRMKEAQKPAIAQDRPGPEAMRSEGSPADAELAELRRLRGVQNAHPASAAVSSKPIRQDGATDRNRGVSAGRTPTGLRTSS